MHRKNDGLKAIVVAPTRELAIQLYKEFLMFNKTGGGDGKKYNDNNNTKIKENDVTPMN